MEDIKCHAWELKYNHLDSEKLLKARRKKQDDLESGEMMIWRGKNLEPKRQMK